MIDHKRLKKATADGVAFICRMCVNWYKGEDMGLTDDDGNRICASEGHCGSPISGKSFGEYDGPLKGHLARYCYICGKPNPEKALEAKVFGSQRIGCCNYCFENEVKRIAKRQLERRVVFSKGEESSEGFGVLQ